ncbi:MAG: gamma-glutamyltransferase [Pseudomonadota bacterium]
MLTRLLLISPAALTLAACADYASAPTPTPAAPQASVKGAVSAADPRAQAAGEAILAKGGSATDAAIAVMLALTVVEPQSSGIGGGGFMVRSDGKGVISYDGRETAPKSATPTRFLDAEGERLPRDQRVTSGLSVGVPGNMALAAKAHAAHGKLPWADLFEPAITLAEDGFVMNQRLNGSISSRKERAGKTQAARDVFFGDDGEPKPVGTRIINPAFAATLRTLASEGASAMYTGSLVPDMASYIAAETPQDGKVTVADFNAYSAKNREPVCGSYRTYKVCGMGPPSSGGVAVIQMLGQLERFDLAALGPDNPEFWHLFLESQRVAYADRALYMGDSDFVSVPVAGMIDRDYIASRSALIDPDKAIKDLKAGTPAGAPLARAVGDRPEENGTTHFSVVDKDGNAVSYTSTIEGAFGSGLFMGGFYLNNELTDFSLTPERDSKPVANRVEGGKRPRSSMAPTIVFDEDGEIVLVIGAAGGPTIPVQVTRSIIGVLDFDMTASEALGLPLIMSFGTRVIMEKDSALEGMEDAFKAKGHDNIGSFEPSLKTNALRRTPAGWEVARDPRIEPKLAYE